MAEDVDAGADHVDDGVDAEEEGESFGGEREGGEESGEDDEVGAGDAGDAFGRELEGGEHQEEGGGTEGDVGGLGDEERGHDQVDGTAGEIETQADGHDEVDDGGGDAEGRDIAEGEGDGGGGRSGGEGDEEGFAGGTPEIEPGDAGPAEQSAEDKEGKEELGGVGGGDELAERGEDRPAVAGERGGDGGADGEGRKEHDVAGVLLRDVGERFSEGDDGAGAIADGLAGGSEEEAEDDERQDVATLHGGDDAGGEGVGDDGAEVEGGGAFEGGAREGEPASGFDPEHHDAADEEGQRSGDLEIDQGAEPDSAEVAELSDPGERADEQAEEEGRDHALDEIQEDSANDGELPGPFGGEGTEHDAGGECDEHPCREAEVHARERCQRQAVETMSSREE